MVKLLQARAVLRWPSIPNGRTGSIVPPLGGRKVRLTAAVLSVLIGCWPAPPLAGIAQFAARVSLVEVYATVTDKDGHLVTGLRQDDFEVEENGHPQVIQAFAAGAFPLSVAVGIDRSFSMTDRALAAAVTATRALADRLKADDQLMVIGIGSETEVLAPLSTDRAGARRALERLARWGTTPLFDAVIQAIDAVQPASGRRALLLLSDGEDRYSRAAASDVVAYARQHDVLIYPIAIGHARVPVWAEVAAVSGGRSFAVRDHRELAGTITTIADELRHQYLLGYAPSSAARSGWRSIKVRVARPQTQVRARDGYFAVER
ncbi:MAG: VWA domain-containing protein [Vicinamibacterales bacterium]